MRASVPVLGPDAKLDFARADQCRCAIWPTAAWPCSTSTKTAV